MNQDETQAPEDEVVDAASEVQENEEAASEKEVAPEELTPEIEALRWKDAALRSAADLENYRKRMAREKLDAIRYANQRLLEELLPALDNFEMGMQAASQEEGSMVYLGMSMVQKQLNDFLEGQGVTVVKTDAAFDPSVHDAVSEEENADLPEGHIVRVMRRGFQLNDRLIRPASVVVSKAPAAGEEAAQSEN